MTIKTFTVNPFQENCFLIYDATKQAALIDPGCYFPQEREAVCRFVEQEGLSVCRLLCTHLHPDHIFGLSFFAEKYNLPVEAHEGDAEWLEKAPWYSRQLGLEWRESELGKPATIGRALSHGDGISFGETTLRVIHTPGHSRGSICFYNEKTADLFSGDTLFQYSVGRSDLPGGNGSDLLRSIQEKLFILPDTVRVHPGHGPSTAIGEERLHNPYA